MVWIELSPELESNLAGNNAILSSMIKIDSHRYVPHRKLLPVLKECCGSSIRKALNQCQIHYHLPDSEKDLDEKKRKKEEYEKFMKKCRDLVEEREYMASIKSLNTKSDSKISIVDDIKEWKAVQQQLVGVINVLFSIAAVFTCCFYLGELSHVDIGFRVLLSLFLALLVAVAEGWFFAKDLLSGG